MKERLNRNAMYHDCNRLQKKLQEETGGTFYVYLDCKYNKFEIYKRPKKSDSWRYMHIGKFDSCERFSMFKIIKAYNKSGCLCCKSVAKKLDSSEKVLQAAFAWSSENPHGGFNDIMWYDKNVMEYHSIKMQSARMERKMEEELNEDVENVVEDMIGEM